MQKNKNNKTIIIFIAIVFLIILLVFFVNYLIKIKVQNLENDILELEQTEQEKYKEAIENAPLGTFKEKVFSVCGKVVEIGSTEMLLYADFYPASPIENPTIAGNSERKIKITENTEIVKQIVKSLEEQNQYQTTAEENLSEIELEMNIITPPEFLKEISSSLSEIKINNEICVVANEDIKEKDEFFGQKLILRHLP